MDNNFQNSDERPTDIWQWVESTDSPDTKAALEIRKKAENIIEQGKLKICKAVSTLHDKGVQFAKPSIVVHHCNRIQSGKTEILKGQKILEQAEDEAWLAYNWATGNTLYHALGLPLQSSPCRTDVEMVKAE